MCFNHPQTIPYSQSVKELPPMKTVPGAKQAGVRCPAYLKLLYRPDPWVFTHDPGEAWSLNHLTTGKVPSLAQRWLFHYPSNPWNFLWLPHSADDLVTSFTSRRRCIRHTSLHLCSHTRPLFLVRWTQSLSHFSTCQLLHLFLAVTSLCPTQHSESTAIPFSSALSTCPVLTDHSHLQTCLNITPTETK